MINALLLITLFTPLAGAIIVGFFGSPFKKYAHIPAVSAIGLSTFTAIVLLFIPGTLSKPHTITLFQWIPVNGFNASFGLIFDNLSAVMLVTVTLVSFLVHVYSIGYMKDDPGYRRYFAYLNLFVFAMLLLVLADNYLLMFVGWEGVGLCSYLLIGFWYEKKTASDAGKKAFIVNRIGDAGFILGIITLFYTFGTVGYVDIQNKLSVSPQSFLVGIEAGSILLFVGAVGKSAQFPLYVWLPDAMEGPTPVSALIHAATMVTAGVYMVARSSFLFGAVLESVGVLVASIGAFTAVFAASIALVNDDIKRILAYSTISQLGYMFVGVGLGAFASGIFHLFTHAFFKALLFLGAGSVMHALNELNIQKMGGLWNKMKTTAITFFIGALALSGIPPFSGFFSKDEIIKAAAESGHTLIWLVVLITVFLTSFYMFRMFFMVFLGRPKDHTLYEHAHESPRVMLYPMIILAFFAITAGWLGIGGSESRFFKFLAIPRPELVHGVETSTNLVRFTPMISILLAVLGIFLAYSIYLQGLPTPQSITNRFRLIYKLLKGKYFVDEIYNTIVVKPLRGLSVLLFHLVDRILVDGTVNGIGATLAGSGSIIRKLSAGNVRNYLLWVLFGLNILLWFLVRGH